MNQVQVEEEKEKIEERKDEKNLEEDIQKNGRRNRFKPDPLATDPHTVIRKDPKTGQITHYETYRPQTNPQNPNQWESQKRYDGTGRGHTNKELQKAIDTPHVHDPNYP